MGCRSWLVLPSKESNLYEKIITPRAVPVITVAQQCNFSHIDLPDQYDQQSPPQLTQDWMLLETFIDAASDQVETLAAQAMVTEEIELTFDFFPGQQDPRDMLAFYQLGYAYNIPPWWWYGWPTKDSIELVRRPVQSGGSPPCDPVVTYNDPNGALQTMDPSTYTVGFNKITLAVGATWPLTDRRQDCIQIQYWAGVDDPADVDNRLKVATMYLGGHLYDHRNHVASGPTQEVVDTLRLMLSSFRSFRIPR